ncbi:MAG: cytochrome c biogenesis protein DipZ [Gammaproteobacteria bacterium]|nr:MAG: cytochrome c biogenesis protein DipZ [Gammaproteobacteria bacterium]
MQMEIANIGLGFLEGFALIISPCILPILPLILAGSFTGSKRRPVGIILGFVIIFALFTFFSRELIHLSGLNPNFIRSFSYGLLILLGLLMTSTYLTEQFARLTQRLASTGSALSSVNDTQGGLVSGMLFGGLVALIWTPCAGPILAAVIVQTVIQQTTLTSFFVILAFSIGAGVPMLMIALFGRGVVSKFSFFQTHTIILRKLLGVIIIASVGYIVYSEGGTSISSAAETSSQTAQTLRDGLSNPYPAPPVAGITAWINSPPLQLSDLKGKVVLIDFWTYSCINCIRTLPYLKAWYAKYHEDGLVIIGVHSPEFEFEKELNNVKDAVAREGIRYPVALDNQFVTWQNYNNRYWPAHYLIDKKGNVVYTHFGEGDYEVTESNIRHLLGLRGPMVEGIAMEQHFSLAQTPETYLGYARAEYFSSPEGVAKDEVAQYSFPAELPQDHWALQGAWKILPDKIVAAIANAAIKIHFYAAKVFIVMGSETHQPIKVSLLLNDKEVKNITVNSPTLYHAVELSHANEGVLQVVTSAPDLEIYTFTFGE